MKRLKVLLYVLAFSLSVLYISAAEKADISYFEESLPYHGTTPREAAVSLFSIDPVLIDVSTQIYSNIMKFTPSLYLQTDIGLTKLNPWDDMTSEELESVKGWADTITRNCGTADEKIRKVMEYVSHNVYYDKDFYNSFDGSNEQYQTELNHNAYDVLTNKTAVCYGYSATVSALLQMSGVPCIIIQSPNHAWNMAYNGERWILFDTTWISNNRYENGAFNKNDTLTLEWYDFTLEKANSDSNHIITGADYCEYNNIIYDAPIYTAYGSFDIPQNITEIKDGVFYGAEELVITGDLRNVTTVGKGAFYNCRRFDGVINLKNASYIDEFAFYGCSEIDGITSLENANYIGTAAFYCCTSVDGTVNIGNLSVIADYAFINCQNLDGVQGIENVTNIGYAAFSGCSQLSGSLDLRNIEFVDEVAFESTSISKVYIPNNSVTIGSYAFWGCPVTIYAHNNSNAHAYATANAIAFGDIDEITFSITYNANGGKDAPDDTVKNYGQTVRIAEATPKKDKSQFIAWSVSQDGSEDYLPGDEYTDNESITLYALWKVADIVYGDVQGDGSIDVSDVIYVLQVLASGNFSDSDSYTKTAADVNCDGKVDVSDIIRMLQYLASPGTSLGP